ncbi:putative entry exclusion protein TrbK-alt [Manganibacter manganicus]|uniref:Conjugal transfer protein TrbK n=1 Tax=Manganibacter manganicus TaxID=1873176 RepID=A0A1V8RU85_9HYPH|nr:putative entry exclusion protein TrbK-alt [Pseudaminobacter manganicus]OQM76725.1 conjugal transfer protein TrbK [Pseudaminobacter manganicus]
MDSRLLARIAAIVFAAVALTATAIEMARQEKAPQPAAFAPAVEPSVDPLRAGQRRCQHMGEAAASNTGCLAVWAETRDRFLGRAAGPAPGPGAPHQGEAR